MSKSYSIPDHLAILPSVHSRPLTIPFTCTDASLISCSSSRPQLTTRTSPVPDLDPQRTTSLKTLDRTLAIRHQSTLPTPRHNHLTRLDDSG